MSKPEVTRKTELHRLCPCPALPKVGLNYPCVFTVDGQHCYETIRPRSTKGEVTHG